MNKMSTFPVETGSNPVHAWLCSLTWPIITLPFFTNEMGQMCRRHLSAGWSIANRKGGGM